MRCRSCTLLVVAAVGCRGTPEGQAVTDAAIIDAPLVVRWTRVATAAPAEVWETGIAYDPSTGSIVQHGGHVVGSYPQSSYTVRYDLATGVWRRSTAPSRPQRRCLVDLVYVDSLDAVLTGNGASSHGSLPQGQPAPDHRSIIKGDPRGPWLYDAVADRWEDARPLGAQWDRYPHGQLAYDPVHDAVVHLAGTTLALYSPRANQVLSRRLPAALHGRQGHGIVALGRAGKILVFGGTVGAQVHDDTWLYDVGADTWEDVSAEVRPPPGMPMHDFLELNLTFHAPLGRAVLFTVPTDQPLDSFSAWPDAELWSFGLEDRRWSRVPAEGARPHFPGLLTSAPDRDALVLLGGGRDGSPARDPRPALSRELWIGEVDVPEASRAPAADPDLLTVETTATSTELSWTAIVGETYEVWRAPATPLPGVYQRVASVTGGRWTDAAAGAAVAYRVVRAGHAWSTGSLPAFNQPRRPQGLRASVERADRVTLTWTAGDERQVVGYHVYRAAGGAVGTRLTPAPVEEPRFVDELVDLGDGVLRAYWVVAVNRGGVASGPSPLAYSMPDAPLQLRVTVDATRTVATVRWDLPADQVLAGVQVFVNDHHENTLGYAGAALQTWWAQWTAATPAPITTPSIEIPLPDPNRDYYVYARAVNLLGQPGFHTDIASPTDPRFADAAP